LKRAAMLAAAVAAGSALAAVSFAGSSWCLGMGGLGPIRAGMTVEQVLALADFPGAERKQPAGECWYLRYHGGGSDFDLMIIEGRVVRLELKGASKLRTFAGARVGTTEEELRALYGARLDVQPHKYDTAGHTITLKSSGGDFGLRFETSGGKVTAIQAGPWEHLNYVEGCG
jgi:hypothetical protein